MHEPTDECDAVHCYEHMVDESGTGYICCGECGHLYQTAGDLRRRYRTVVWDMWRRQPRIFRSEWTGPGLFGILFMMATVRAKKIYFCQYCIHDF